MDELKKYQLVTIEFSNGEKITLPSPVIVEDTNEPLKVVSFSITPPIEMSENYSFEKLEDLNGTL